MNLCHLECCQQAIVPNYRVFSRTIRLQSCNRCKATTGTMASAGRLYDLFQAHSSTS